jgi:hypothetical protein
MNDVKMMVMPLATDRGPVGLIVLTWFSKLLASKVQEPLCYYGVCGDGRCRGQPDE